MKKDKNLKSAEELKREFYEGMRELREETRELKESQKKTHEQLKKTDKQLRRQIGDLTDGWGKFTEGLVAPSIPKLFKMFGIEIHTNYQRAKKRRNGREMEIDILSIGRREENRRIGESAKGRKEKTERKKDNTEVIIAVEVKSNLESRNVDDFKNNLTKFFQFFEEYKGMDLIGIVTGIRMEKDVEKYAQRVGFYVLGPSGETMKILNSKGFRPKIWGRGEGLTIED